MDVEFAFSGMRVTKGAGESIQKEDSDRKVEMRKAVSSRQRDLKVQQTRSHPCIAVQGT